MKNLDEVKVSVYVSVHAKKNDAVTLLAVLAAIKNGKVKDVVWAARRYWADGDSKAANAMKQKLPCFTVSGLFEGGHAVKNLIEATGYIILDFDEVDDLENLRAVCEGDTHTVGAFRSPLKGYKVIAHVENAEGRHREAYELVRAHYEEITGLPVDASGKDISRTCYFSYDPECYIAALYDSFVLPVILSSEEASSSCHSEERSDEESVSARRMYYSQKVVTDGSDSSHSLRMTKEGGMTKWEQGVESFEGREADFIRANLLLHPLREGNRNSGAFALGCKAAKAGYNLDAIYANLAKEICSEGFTEEELKRTLDSAYQKIASSETTPKQDGRKGVERVKGSKGQYKASGNDTDGEEAWQEGEELRRHTPYLPEEMYGNIPDFLTECLDEDMLPRSRDVRLLSCISVLSALLPATIGRYKGKDYTPHIYALVIAPPASGKGDAGDALRLAELVNKVTEHESDSQWKAYERQKEEYELCRQRNRKAKEKVEQPEKPDEPPYRSLILPANISLSRMIIQLLSVPPSPWCAAASSIAACCSLRWCITPPRPYRTPTSADSLWSS